eukprot:gene10082-7979_t
MLSMGTMLDTVVF